MSSRIETRVTRMHLGEDGIFRVIYLPGAEIVLSDVQEVSRLRVHLTGDGRVPMYTDAREVKSVTREARNHGASSGEFSSPTALGILVGSPVSKVLGNLFIGLSKPSYPTRLFTSEEEAIAWLQTFTEQDMELLGSREILMKE